MSTPPGPRHRDDLLSYWFASSDDDATVAARQARLWWQHDPDTDAELEQRFGGLVEAAAAGRLDDWAQEPRGRLALILLLDQLPRAIYRGSPAAFATDEPARRLTIEALGTGQLVTLRPIEQVFALLPLEHAEDLELQERSVAEFTRLAAAVPQAWHTTFAGFIDYAERHRDIIARFARFPHRNAILGRESTPEEDLFLSQPGSSF